MNNELKVFSGSAHPELTAEICKSLGCRLGECSTKHFADGEIYFRILENVRGADVFLVQPTCTPVNDHLVELMLMIDAFRRSSARRITAVLPYFGYARQDRKDQPRVPISSKVVSDALAANSDRLLTMDLHAAQIQGFFDIPVDHLFASPVLVDFFQDAKLENLTVVSPDPGGVERARAFARRLDGELAIIDKRRADQGPSNEAKVMNVVGDVKGRTALIVDDMVDTAGTLVHTVEALRDAGAVEVYACATHGVLSGPAIEKIQDSSLQELVVTDTVPLRPDAKACGKIRVLSVAKLLAQAIESIHDETSVSVLFI
jgi:ribose-phosphate pyrophosphokinase